MKLENLLLARPNDLGSLKLADFGFATEVSDARGRRLRCALFERKDAAGDRLQGTAEYAAPEILSDLARAAEASEEKEKEKDGRAVAEGVRSLGHAAPPARARAGVGGARAAGGGVSLATTFLVSAGTTCSTPARRRATRARARRRRSRWSSGSRSGRA